MPKIINEINISDNRLILQIKEPAIYFFGKLPDWSNEYVININKLQLNSQKFDTMSMVDSFEKIPVKIFDSLKDGSKFVALEIATLIRDKQSKGENCVLGLATGSTPKTLYNELVRLHLEEGLSFENVITFNLDEYYPIDNDALQSYNRFMKEHLFNKINIDQSNCYLPNGEWEKESIKIHCQEYEAKIESFGGIDLQILGIGNNGHIGFNEPGSSLFSKTRLVPLDNSTRIANSHEFQNISKVPALQSPWASEPFLKRNVLY